MRKKSPYPVILDLLTKSYWYAPHEVNLQLRLAGCHVAPEATTARMRDLRKAKYGGHCLRKQKRRGTGYFEYRVIAEQ